ncbi:lactonase family protein [Hymenobacter qilianensis]|uniref:hypothetical protein n=1 Tax=Hymenobacter qilianensis TaxID=1385715 RepID=UPI001CB8A303|nr:hypothetical protein [Hymenobacter qilianensis]
MVAATKNTLLTRGTAEKMTGVFHKNGCDIWIIVHGWGEATSGTENRGDSFLAYRVTPAGVQSPPIISTVGARHAPSVSPQGYRGQMKVSPDGEQLAVARYSETLGDNSSTVELFAFDAETGIVSNPQIVDQGAGRYYGVEFSPSRNYLYATVQSPPQLLQFDLSATNITASKQVIPLNQNPRLIWAPCRPPRTTRFTWPAKTRPAWALSPTPIPWARRPPTPTTAWRWAGVAAGWVCPTSIKALCCASESERKSRLAAR